VPGNEDGAMFSALSINASMRNRSARKIKPDQDHQGISKIVFRENYNDRESIS